MYIDFRIDLILHEVMFLKCNACLPYRNITIFSLIILQIIQYIICISILMNVETELN